MVTAYRACVVAWPAVALPWLRWGARASMVEGPPTEQVGEGGSSLELLADGKGLKNRDEGGEGWRPASEKNAEERSTAGRRGALEQRGDDARTRVVGRRCRVAFKA
jgi:hypothetical protein